MSVVSGAVKAVSKVLGGGEQKPAQSILRDNRDAERRAAAADRRVAELEREAAAKAKADTDSKRRRLAGHRGTIATSGQGVTGAAPVTRKTLLGAA